MGTRPFFPRRLLALPMLWLIAALLIAFGQVAPAAAQQTQGATGTNRAEGKAIVLRQLSFFRVQDLDFGNIIAGSAPGTVRLLPAGTRTATGGAVLVGNSQQPARFAGLGTVNRQVSISVSSNTIQLTGPGTAMTVSLFEIGSTPTVILTTTPLIFRIASANGQFNFPVGATLAVGANQAPGVYNGSFVITLNYL